jgi:hypothetical protein
MDVESSGSACLIVEVELVYSNVVPPAPVAVMRLTALQE